jgi:thiol-disulfide isomerase/thioredoxin
MKRLIPILIFIVLVSFGCNSQNDTLTTHLYNLRDKKYANESYQDIIDKYKGKVIYMDFWASWCGPCKREMPHSLKMQEHFKGKDVVFVYMSSDRSVQQWKQAIEKLKITGEHYLLNEKVYRERNKVVEVKYIPRYMLYDKNGKLVTKTAPRPSNKKSTEMIEELLKK